MDEVEAALLVLTERRNWLNARIDAKLQVGWDTEWDRRERDALTTVIDYMSAALIEARKGPRMPQD